MPHIFPFIPVSWAQSIYSLFNIISKVCRLILINLPCLWEIFLSFFYLKLALKKNPQTQTYIKVARIVY